VTRNQTWLALAGLLALSFLGLARDLWTPDEPREAEIAREMWLAPTIVPRLNGERFIEKPPLYYWTVAGAYALLGGPSPAAARAVSALAAFGTLVMVLFWGGRAFSPVVGLAAAVGLATSAQFMWTSHWIVMDSLLMLFTTAAFWAAHELLQRGASRNVLLAFYAALLAALWTKGPIGPVLVGCGLLAYAAARRSFAVLAPLRPFAGAAFVVLMFAGVAAAIAADSGWDAVREWLWVNQVERVTNPVTTGHDQPVLYYLWTLPVAVFPWWLPFGALFRPRTWTGEKTPWHDSKLALGAAALGMALLLSVPATKRGLYLMPVLPPLMLLLAAVAAEWWSSSTAQRLRGAVWLSQAALVALSAAVPTVAVLATLHIVDAHAISFLIALAVLLVALAAFSLRGERTTALATLATCSIAAAVGLLTVAAPLAAPRKDLSPFVAWVGGQIPSAETLYVTGEIDETLDGIVPFVTGRHAEATTAAEIEAKRPRFVLVQGKNGASAAAALAAPYHLLASSEVGTDRYLALWSRDGEPRAGDAQHNLSSSPGP
jgi:4-amino-4-deoxy-L-arabinose transferase-like glycosyltransferase